MTDFKASLKGERATAKPKRKPTRAKKLGVTDEDYAIMLTAQDGHCALCPTRPKTRRLDVDHDHKTGAVRALLCHRCNRALPTWATPEWLRRAAGYLEVHARLAA